MKVAVLGATGPSGLQLVCQALDKGHEVTAIVRSPDKLSHIQHEKLQVVKGDLFSEDDLTRHFGGMDAVLIALGCPPKLPFTTITLHSDTIKPIVAAMRNNNVKRMVVITAWCTKYTPTNPKRLEWFFKPLVIGRNLDDMGRMEDYLEQQCQDIDYTVVRPPGLTNDPISDKEMEIAEDYHVPSQRNSMARADVARFMLDCLDQGLYFKKMVAIIT